MSAELRWILLALCVPLLAGIWWWTTRKSSHLSPGDSTLREPTLSKIAEAAPPSAGEPRLEPDPVRPDPASRARGRGARVSALEPLEVYDADHHPPMHTDLGRVPVLDMPMMASPDALPPQAAPPPARAAVPPVSQAVAPPPARAAGPTAQAAAQGRAPGSAPAAAPTRAAGSPPAAAATSARAPDPPPAAPRTSAGAPGSPPPAQPTTASAPSSAAAAARPSPASAAESAPESTAPPLPPSAAGAAAPSPPATPGGAAAAAPAERQKIVTLRVSATGDTRWSGAELRGALELHGLAYGKYHIFHRRHTDGQSVYGVASLVEPGTFDLSVMEDQEFRGVTMFAVLPGAIEPMAIVDDLLTTARGLAEALSGSVQDAKGMPMSPQRAAALREDVARFQTSLS